MEVALIAPRNLVSLFCLDQKYQMMLPDVVLDDNHGEYTVSYRFFCLHPKFYVILDNGAWETQALTPEQLMRMARTFRVQEIVAPDVMSPDPYETLTVMDHFFKEVDKMEFPANWDFAFAAVAHGHTEDIAKDFIEEVAFSFPRVKTIALAKNLVLHTGDSLIRVKLAEHLRRLYSDRFECHLLGYNEESPDELQAPARSIDATTPFTQAMEGHEMFASVRVPRSRNYFSLTREDFHLPLLEQNIREFNNRARTRRPSSGQPESTWTTVDNL